jgi:hypothetical protein
MQNKKLINFGGATVGEKGVYSIEFHEDDQYAQVKRANRDGTADYFLLDSTGAQPTRLSPQYERRGHDASALAFTSNTTRTVDLNGGGFFHDDSRTFAPIAGALSSNQGIISLAELSVGDTFTISFDINVTPNNSNADFTLEVNWITQSGIYTQTLWEGGAGHSSGTKTVSGSKMFTVVDEAMKTAATHSMRMTCNADGTIVPLWVMITKM